MPEVAELGLRSTEFDANAVDAAVIVTAHPDVDHEAVARDAPLVVDFRGVLRGVPGVVAL